MQIRTFLKVKIEVTEIQILYYRFVAIFTNNNYVSIDTYCKTKITYCLTGYKNPDTCKRGLNKNGN